MGVNVFSKFKGALFSMGGKSGLRRPGVLLIVYITTPQLFCSWHIEPLNGRLLLSSLGIGLHLCDLEARFSHRK